MIGVKIPHQLAGDEGVFIPLVLATIVVAGESYFLPQPMPFRLQAKFILLTYSQVDNEDVFLRDPQAHFDHCARLWGLPVVYRLGRELHEDGGTHFHAFVGTADRCSTRNERLFDYHGYHPNVRGVRSTPAKAYDYAGKDDDIIYEFGEKPGGHRASGNGRDRAWGDALSASCKEAFLDCIRQNAPRDYVLYHEAILRFVERHFAEDPPEYTSPMFETDRIDALVRWVNQAQLGGERWGGRPRSLILWGPTRTGKTVWARSLGKP